jgi:hypothetical protein
VSCFALLRIFHFCAATKTDFAILVIRRNTATLSPRTLTTLPPHSPAETLRSSGIGLIRDEIIGIRRRVSKGVEEDFRLPALRSTLPETTLGSFQGWPPTGSRVWGTLARAKKIQSLPACYVHLCQVVHY